MKDVIWGLQYFHKIDTPGNKKFVDAYKAEYNEIPPYIAANPYINIMTMLQAIERAKSDDPMKVIDATEDYEYEGLTGVEKYRACDHQMVKPYYSLRCKGADQMKSPEDFADIIGQSTNIEPCAETGCKMS